MEDRDRILDYTKPVRLPDDCNKSQKNFTQGYFYREIGRYKNAVPSEFQWAAEDKLINKSTYEELKCQLPDSPRSTFLMVFSPDGKKVASTHGNHNVYVTDLTTGRNIQTLSGHPRTPWCIAFHPSSNQILASGCLGGQVRVWDLHGGSEVWTAGSQTVIASLAFHPVDRMLVIATYNELHFWDWSQPEPFAKCSTKSGREKVRYVSFDRLGNKLITGIANPVSVPSQWDRINVVNSQPPMTSTTTTTTTTTTSFNSTPPTTVVSTQPSNDQGRSLTAWYRNFMNRYNELVNMSRNTPTIDRGTDPMDLLDLRSNGSTSEGSTNNPSPSTSSNSPAASTANPSSPLRFKITRSGGRPYRSVNSRERSLRFRIHSSILRNLSNRSSQLSSSLCTTAASTSVTQTSGFTNPTSMSSPPTPSPSVAPRLRRCAFSLGPTARTWCLTLSPESSGLFSTRNTTPSSSSGAVTNPTYTSYSDRGIFSTRESSPNSSERSQFSLVRPYRLLFDDPDNSRTTLQRGTQHEREEGSSSSAPIESSSNLSSNSEQTGSSRNHLNNSTPNSPERTRSSSRNTILNSPDDLEIERELQRPTSDLQSRGRESETTSSTPNAESSYNSEHFRSNRSSSIFQLAPVDLRNVSPVRRFRDDSNSDGELTGRESHSFSQCLLHPRPVPRFQVRSRLLQDQQSQLQLITNRETHGLNLQNNQSLRRQLSFRPGGQFVLSRHSNSPFQPRVPHHIDSPTQESSPSSVKTNMKDLRPEIPSVRSSFTASVSSNTNTPEGGTSASSSSGSVFPPSSVASNLSFSGEGSSRQLPEQINRRLFDRVKMMLRDRIRNSSENASTDSTVNYSRISLESDEAKLPRGLGPRGADPMLSSASENLDTSNELLTNSGNSSPVPETSNGLSPNSNNLNMSQSELLDPWESETDTVPFSLSSPLSLNNVLSEQGETAQESTSHETGDRTESNETPSTSNNDSLDNSNSSPEFSMRQGIQLLSLHIENMQRLCWARIEILQLQKIRRMWEDLTNQIRHFHNIIQNRTSGDNSNSSEQNDPNSGGDIPGMRNLAISGSPTPESNPQSSTSSDTQNDANAISNYKELVESMVSELFNESQRSNSSNQSNAPSAPPFHQGSSSSDVRPTSSQNSGGRQPGSSSAGRSSEEPQPGPSGVSNPHTSRGNRDSILHFEYRVYRLLRDIIQKTRRRREGREPERSNLSLFRRQSQCFGLRNSSRTRFRSHRTRNFLHSLSLRSRALNRELESIWQTWRNERAANKPSQPGPSTSSSGEVNQPSTSTPKSSGSGDACQSCGQKKKPVKEFCRQKKRCVDSSGSPGQSCSASKVLKNNVGERSEAPNREVEEEEQSTSSGTQESSTNDLLKQMLQTMETMLRFQRQAFQRTKDGTGEPSGEAPPFLPSSDDDSDSDHNDSNEARESLPGETSRSSRSSRETVINSMQDIVQIRAKKLLGFLVKSLNLFFGKNFSNLNQVLDEQIFRLYMLLDLALELTDLLLDQLNARSRDLERSWTNDNAEPLNPDNRERSWSLSRTGGVARRMRERSRNLGRSSCIPPYAVNREDNLRYRFSANPFQRFLSSLISSRLDSSGSPNTSTAATSTTQERFPPSSSLSGSSRRKRRTARMSTTLSSVWYNRNRSSQGSSHGSNPLASKRTMTGNPLCSRYRNFRFDRRPNGDGIRAFDYEFNNNRSSNDTNNNYRSNDDRNNNSNNNNNNNNNSSSNSLNVDNRNASIGSNNSDISNNNNNNNNFLNYYFPNSSSSSSNSEGGNNIIILTGLSSGSDIINSNSNNMNGNNNNNEGNSSRQSGSNTFLSQSTLPPLRSMELTLSRNESGDLSLRDERPIFWIRYGGNGEASGSSNSIDSQSRVSSFTVPVVQVNDVPVSDVSMLNQPRHRPQSPVPRVPEEIWRWRAWRPRFLHPRYVGPNPFDDQDSNDVPENIHYYRILSTSAGSHLGVYTLDPMIITDAPLSPHHRIQAWDFSKMDIPDISDREANGVVPECKIHNDASVDVSNDGHLLVTLLPFGRLSVTTMLGVYSLDWSSLGQLLYRTSFEQNAVSVSLSPTNRHLLVGLASRPVVVRDRTNMAQIFRLEGGRPSPHGGSWQSGRGRLVHMRDLEQTREANIMSLNCIRWAPGAGQGLVYGTNTGQLKVLR